MVRLTRCFASILDALKNTATAPTGVLIAPTTSTPAESVNSVSFTLEDVSIEPSQINLSDESTGSSKHKLPTYPELLGTIPPEFQALILEIIQASYELNAKVMVLQADAESKDEAINNLKMDAESKDEAINDLKTDAESKDEAINDLKTDAESKDEAINDLKTDAESKDEAINDLKMDAESKDQAIKKLEADGERKDHAAVKAKKNRGYYKKHRRIAHSEMCKLRRELRAAHEEGAALRGNVNKAIKMVTQFKKTVQKKLSKEKLFTRHVRSEMNRQKKQCTTEMEAQKNQHTIEMEAQTKQHTSEVQDMRSKLTNQELNIKNQANTSNKKLADRNSKIKELKLQIEAPRHVNVKPAILARAMKKDKVRHTRTIQTLQGELKRKTKETLYLKSDAYLSNVVSEKERVMDSLCRELHKLRLYEVEQQQHNQTKTKNRKINRLTRRKNHILSRLEAIKGAPRRVPQPATTASSSDQSTTAGPVVDMPDAGEDVDMPDTGGDVDMPDAKYDSGYDTDDCIR